jgi:hypothetical protein
MLLGSSLLGLVGAVAIVRAGESAPAAGESVIDPRADTALRQMSAYVAGLKSFRLEATTVDEHITTDGQKIQELKDSKVSVKRPNALSVERTGPAGHVLFRYDGKRFAWYGVEKNVYASEPAPARLDAAVDEARDRLHIDAPGGDLIVSDPYHALLDGVTVGRYIGLEQVNGVMAHHLAMTKADVDWQIWIQDGPEPLPLRYVITSKDMPGRPQFTLEMRNWQAEVPLSEASFTFVPPPGAKQIELAKMRKGSLGGR